MLDASTCFYVRTALAIGDRHRHPVSIIWFYSLRYTAVLERIYPEFIQKLLTLDEKRCERRVFVLCCCPVSSGLTLIRDSLVLGWNDTQHYQGES